MASLQKFIGMGSFSGAGAQAVKDYLADVHLVSLVALGEILTELLTRYCLYEEGYFAIDGDMHAQLDEAKLDERHAFFGNSWDDFAVRHQRIKAAFDSVSDIVAVAHPDPSHVSTDYHATKEGLKSLKEAVNAHEGAHKAADFANLDAMIEALRAFIAGNDARDRSAATEYRSYDTQVSPAFTALCGAVNKAVVERSSMAEAVSAAEKARTDRFTALAEELAAQREEEGREQAIVGVAIVALGLVVGIASLGFGAPAAVAIASSGATMIYGAYEAAEGVQDWHYGSQGDLAGVSVNGLRDYVFLGNQQAYDAFGHAAIFAETMVAAPAAAASFGAAAAPRVGYTTELFYQNAGAMAYSSGAGVLGEAGGYYAARAFGAPEGAAQIIGAGAGIAAGGASAPKAFSKFMNYARITEAEASPVAAGWKVGDPIDNLTAAGDVPAWSTVRQRYWKNEALGNDAAYNSENVARMQQGLAPQQVNSETGKLESMELHHIEPQRDKSPTVNYESNLMKVWPDEHAAIDEYRYLGGE
jgi:hypothetical protein